MISNCIRSNAETKVAMRAQRQKVRGIETRGADKDDIVIVKAKYQSQLQECKQFCKDMDLDPWMGRVYIDGLGRIAIGKTSYSVANGGRNVIINKKDYMVPRSIGAAARRYNVRLLEGGNARLKEGSKITKIKTFAGKGTNKEIRDRFKLESQYEHPANEWQKNRGEAVIIHKGHEYKVEIHWYEANGEKVLMKVKRYLDES